MNFRLNVLQSIAIAFFMSLQLSIEVLGQDKAAEIGEAKAMEAANSQLVEVLDKTDGLFYKAIKRENGTTYNIKWEQDGEITKMNLLLERQGTYDSKPVFALFAYSMVAESEKAFPPAIIKMVPVKSDNSRMSSYVMSEKLDTVFVKAAIPSDTLTAGQIWMLCVHVHRARVSMKKEIDQLLSASSK